MFLPKEQYAEWLETYTRLMRLNFWGSAPATSATYDPAVEAWTVSVERDGETARRRDGETAELHPHHLVLVNGAFGEKPQLPDFPGQGLFQGDQLHSSQFVDSEGVGGTRVVVVGSGVSAHDVSAALASAGADVTMIQRSSTHPVPTP
ncbi:FAD-dependent oxidoreductase [Sciscionella marina]|uniref:FAD-dependent oxidoreductase n=1 Tax=Sciscionella marina TaxID=508770 RepID=UPI00036BA1C4|nr:FAD-dependent oxidoreductase [Sciscionella marina]